MFWCFRKNFTGTPLPITHSHLPIFGGWGWGLSICACFGTVIWVYSHSQRDPISQSWCRVWEAEHDAVQSESPSFHCWICNKKDRTVWKTFLCGLAVLSLWIPAQLFNRVEEIIRWMFVKRDAQLPWCTPYWHPVHSRRTIQDGRVCLCIINYYV